MLKRLFEFLLNPSARFSVLALVGVGLVVGVLGVVTFDKHRSH